jgi:hypothetical protein
MDCCWIYEFFVRMTIVNKGPMYEDCYEKNDSCFTFLLGIDA